MSRDRFHQELPLGAAGYKASGIVSDANRYAIETVGDPRYPLDLLLRVITMSLETMKIVRALPEVSAATDA